MTTLEQLKPGQQLRGLAPDTLATLIQVQWHGANAVTVVFRRDDGSLGQQLLYRQDEAKLELVEAERRWSFSSDGATLRLVSEAYRINLAHLFDPVLAIHTSLVEPLPHQITAVYNDMLPRQPLRFLLADDPGAGKTIMAGLLIRELMVRGDVRRCLIVAPGSLTEQWQDELWGKFQLDFKLLSRESVENARSGNPFLEQDLIIARLDQISRSEELQARLEQSEWDLVVCDEAHKMSAHYFGLELEETKRYRLGKLLGKVTRHLLLMTATPHNGKEEDFHLFLALLDADRFEGKPREGAKRTDVSDLMRRMVKENLLKFDGKPLFPERKAYTVSYALSAEEMALYEAVTAYVREQFNRAEQLESEGRKGTVGFALTVLQRRLASSPEAIYQSLVRRRERLEKRLQEARQAHTTGLTAGPNLELRAEEDWDDLDDAPDAEIEAVEAQVVDNATAAQTLEELQAEIATLRMLEDMAGRLRRSGVDRKWQELQRLIHDTPEMQAADGNRRKLVIFTEHRDTLTYLQTRLSTLLGRPDQVVVIHGGLHRQERREIEEQFRSEPHRAILIATDAAGEGINLQRAHLMVNYDLPWNPNRLEQRFGRIHRIGQTEVCHLWNLVATETREGHVYARLLKKLEAERHALDGQVFDVLGKVFEDAPLRRLLVDAIRYGDDPVVRARLEQAVDNAVDRERLADLLAEHSLATAALDTTQVMRIREEMERYAARRLQPYYIKAFFEPAFARLGGTLSEREPGRYSICYVPGPIREFARNHGLSPIPERYERICFDKTLIRPVRDGQALAPAAFIAPGHPLLEAVIGLLLQRERSALTSGAILIDPADPSTEPRALLYLEQAVQDALPTKSGEPHVISRQVHFVELSANGEACAGGGAPYLDYRPPTAEEQALVWPLLEADWLRGDALDQQALAFAVTHLIPEHLNSVREQRIAWVDKTLAAVYARLTREINYWDLRAAELSLQEQAGKTNARLNSQQARRRADQLAERLALRQAALRQEREVSAPPPVIIGGALVIPMGLLLELQGAGADAAELIDRQITEQIAMRAVLEAEIALGHDPVDVSAQKVGYDILSRDGQTGRMRFIEVKGRRAGADTVTVTANEILTACNAGTQYILALVPVEDGTGQPPRYVRSPFVHEPGPGVTSVNYNLADLMARSQSPS